MEILRISELDDLKWRSIVITNNQLFLSTRKHDKFESYKLKVGSEYLGETREEIPYHQILRSGFIQGGNYIKISRVKKNNLEKKYNLDVDQSETVELIINQIKKSGEFIEIITKPNLLKVLQKPLLTLIPVILFFFIGYNAAIGIENGLEASIDGKKQLTKNIILTILEVIGSTGVLILGLLTFGVFIYQIIKTIKNPPQAIEIKRKKYNYDT